MALQVDVEDSSTRRFLIHKIEGVLHRPARAEDERASVPGRLGQLRQQARPGRPAPTFRPSSCPRQYIRGQSE